MLENRAGKELVAIGAQETSSIVVETVAKYSKGHGNVAPVLPHFKSDATKVTSKGMGLKKAFLGKQNQFTINATEAGKCQTKYGAIPNFLSFFETLTQANNSHMSSSSSSFFFYELERVKHPEYPTHKKKPHIC